MSPVRDVDLLVVGGGAAGLVASGLGARLGARTLLVERARLGGECTWSGCVPSKALLAAAATAHAARTADRFGLGTAALEVDLARVMERVRAISTSIFAHADSPEVVRARGVDVLEAELRFTGSGEAVAGGERVRFRWAIVATGSAPILPPIPGLDAVDPLTNETIFGLERLPRRLLVLGGGPIGVELGQAFARLGSEVTVIERAPNLLPRDDPELVAHLEAALGAEGVRLELGATVERARREGGDVVLELAGRPALRGDRLLVAGGRIARVEGLGLETLGVRADPAGIEVDRAGRTTARRVYAIGDCARGPRFSHWAEHSAKVAVLRALLGLPARLDPGSLPWVTYTDPEVAHVGASRADLERAGRPFEAFRFPFDRLDRAVAQRRERGEVRVYAARGRVLGASAVGASAGEVVALLGLARARGIPLRRVSDTLHAYPTYALAARRVADQWYARKLPVRFLRALAWLRGLRGSIADVDRSEVV